jgi:DAACS family dicarboxylate/amino acid:cation (Na+ or H+) symporter
MSDSPRKGWSQHNQILFALILGAGLGVAANALTPAEGPARQILDFAVHYVLEPVGKVFLRLLFLTVVPLVVASLALGVAELGAEGHLGRIGLKTFAYFIATMTCAVVIGLTLVAIVQPGAGLPEETQNRLKEKYGQRASEKTSEETEFGIDTFVNIVPTNPIDAMARMDMLAVIFFALLIGMGLNRINPDHARTITSVLQGVNDLMVVIIGWAMQLAPYGVFGLVFSTTAAFGFQLLELLGWYVFVVLAGLALQMFGVLSILLATMARVRPWEFFRRIRAIMITAFSTSSSNATLPTTIQVSEEELGIPPPIAGFVLPLGATMNMNGTALYEGVTVVFLAQVFGIELTLTSQLIIVVMAVLTAIGAAGVPGGSLPLLVMVLKYVGVPELGIALILGVDRLLDMCRTTLNVVGDVTAAAYVARSEGHEIMKPKADAQPNDPA